MANGTFVKARGKDLNQKNKSVASIAQDNAFVFLIGPPKCSKRLAALACTRSSRRSFVSRKDPAGDSLRSAPKIERIQVCCTKGTVPLGFCCGGFSSTAGYVPGNEARVPKDSSGVAPVKMINPAGVIRFYPDNSCLAFRRNPSKPFGFGSGVSDSGFPLLLSTDGASPLSSPLPGPVKMPVSNLDFEAILHPLILMSSIKYFNYGPLFTDSLWKFCGYLGRRFVDKNVEKTATEPMARLRRAQPV